MDDHAVLSIVDRPLPRIFPSLQAILSLGQDRSLANYGSQIYSMSERAKSIFASKQTNDSEILRFQQLSNFRCLPTG